MKRAAVLLAVLALSACGGHGSAGTSSASDAARANSTPSDAPTPPSMDALNRQPQRLVIDSIGVDAAVEDLGVVLASPRPRGAAATLAMAVPSKPTNVGWYAQGASPGDSTGAVTFDGHLDWPVNGKDAPAVFARVGELTKGAAVKVVTVGGQTYTYKVATSDKIAPNAAVPYLFTKTDPPTLYLITCIGRWDGTQYDHRLVVKAAPVS